MATVDKISVQISAEIGSLKRDLDQARAELRGFQGSALSAADASNRAFAKMQRELQGISTAAKRSADIMSAAFAGVAGYGVYELGEALGEVSKKLVDMSEAAKRAGLSIGQMQGLQTAAFAKGIDAEDVQEAAKEVGKLIAEAGRGEGELKELFEANNVKIKDRNGNLLTTVETLARIADLVRNAGSEADKLKILEDLGIDEKLVRVLEKGGAAIRDMLTEADKLTPELQRHAAVAAEFESAWRGAWAGFKSAAASEIAETMKFLTEVIQGAERLIGKVQAARAAAVSAAELVIDRGGKGEDALEQRRQELLKSRRDIAARQGKTTEVQLLDEQIKVAAKPQTLTGERFTGQRDAFDRTPAPITPGTGTKFKDKEKGGGGGGKSGSDQSAEEKQIERFILTLEKEARAVKAEAEAFFLSNVEKQTAINLAKAGEKATDDQKKQIEAATKTLVEQQEALRALKLAKEGVNEAFQFGGSMLLDFANGMIEGGKASDLMKNSLKRLSAALLEMAILGQGPLAKLFGTSGRDGAPGGLIGMLMGGFGKGGVSLGGSSMGTVGDVGGFARAFAGGGPAGPGWAMVGENGPELIRLGRSAEVYSAGQTRMMVGGGGARGGYVINQTIMGNGDATIAAIARQAVIQGISANNANWNANAEAARLRGG